ncbi:HD domain-containing protein [Curtobacterium flaccumfaciens pv. flaccumfaciens]|nr:HD domain-containing protein [Curtobacterium flaccumfaciens pv. flaccumfaciens]
MSVDVEALLTPPSPVAARALDVVRAWSEPALVNHCLRSWAWAVLLAPTVDLEPDPELLFVATMLHDLGVTPSFDAHRVPFEDAGGAVGSVFALGAGWDAVRARRVGEIIERHMWRSVDPGSTPRGTCSRGRPRSTSPAWASTGGRRTTCGTSRPRCPVWTSRRRSTG